MVCEFSEFFYKRSLIVCTVYTCQQTTLHFASLFFTENIESGKSSVLESLASTTDYLVIKEHTPMWESFLRAFYSTPSTMNALMLQESILHSLVFPIKGIVEAGSKGPFKLVLMERSAEDLQIFISNLDSLGMWREHSTAVLNGLLRSNPIYPTQGRIYLKTTPEVSKVRCSKRYITGEKSVSLDYLSSINVLYDNWLSGPTAPPNTYIINANTSLEEVILKTSSKIKEMIAEHDQLSSANTSYSFVI